METGASSSDSHSTIEIEFEAAETLAGLAHSSMRDTESEEQSHRVNNESPSPDPVPSEDQEETGQQQYGKVEKEARRIRRVLANRESARQTIHRRKALYEELPRKAANLTEENENLKAGEYYGISTSETRKTVIHVNHLKLEKETAVKEYDTLKRTNECLKVQMAMIMNKVEETRVDSKKSPTNQCSEHSCVWLPFPWFVPVPDHGNESSFRPSFDLSDYQSRASSSSKTIACVEKHHPLLPSKVRGASSSVSPVPANNLFETPFGFMPDGGGQCKGLHPQILVLMPAQLNSTGPTSTAKNESDHRPDYIPGAQVFSSAVDQAVNALPEARQDLNACPSEKQADSNAAAGARKRRKELKKLESQNSRQFG
ncbi:Basic-leucine zipper (bZIP) transcription factor family protein [Actinidia rufa]|uniref:Basic-leucine zipper (BZIP) transcription factor family protein n=1 Tax=Actinidia rufa TaxID=165716 RepID=A0A7J0H1A7_9ERIC|nr:Basic-leucine zipper (bZIP) transcription factor family protein [Actinidia rufa]